MVGGANESLSPCRALPTGPVLPASEAVEIGFEQPPEAFVPVEGQLETVRINGMVFGHD